MPTIYASNRGLSPQQYQDQANQPLVRTPRGQMTPLDWLGGTARNLQQDTQTIARPDYDIPGNVQAPVQNIPQGIPNPEPTQVAQSAQAPDYSQNQDQGDVGPQQPLPVSSPSKLSKDPTNGVKTYTPEHVQQGAQAISYGMQNNLPAPQSDVQAATQQQDHAKLQSDLQAIAGSPNPKKAWQEVSQGPFYKDSNFYTGLMNVGLAIMSGASPLQAAQLGKQEMDKGHMASQLGANRQALMDQGYSPASIDAAITSGDTSKLKMQEMSDQDKMQAQSDMWAKQEKYRTDLSNIEKRDANNEWDRRFNLQQGAEDKRASNQEALYQQHQEAQFAQQKALMGLRLDAKQQAAKDKEEADLKAKGGPNYDWTDKEAGAYQRQNRSMFSNQAVRIPALHGAQEFADSALKAYEKGDRQTTISAANDAATQLTRALTGGAATLDTNTINELAKDPAFIVNGTNDVKLKAGMMPNRKTLEFIQKAANNALDVESRVFKGQLADATDRVMSSKGWNYDKARNFVNFNIGQGVGVTLDDDYYNSRNKQPAKVNASQGSLYYNP